MENSEPGMNGGKGKWVGRRVSVAPSGPGQGRSPWARATACAFSDLDAGFASSAWTLDLVSSRNGLLFGQGGKCSQCFYIALAFEKWEKKMSQQQFFELGPLA